MLLPTRCHSQQFLLHSVDQGFDLVGGSPPDDQAMPGVYISRLNRRVAQSREDRVDADACEVRV